MSYSKEERQANVDYAMNLFFTKLGNQWIRTFFIDPTHADFSEICPTTWGELTERYSYIKALLGGDLYALTPSGWLKCLEFRAIPKTPEFQRDVGKLCASLKDYIKGRKESALVTVEALAAETNLPAGFICNLMDADFINLELRRYSASWASGLEGRMLVIPTNCGLEWL